MSNYIQRQKDLLSKKYGKDELVAALLKDIKDLKIEKGKMQSEIDELVDVIKTNNEEKLTKFFIQNIVRSREVFTKNQVEKKIEKAVNHATNSMKQKMNKLRQENERLILVEHRLSGQINDDELLLRKDAEISRLKRLISSSDKANFAKIKELRNEIESLKNQS
jgi:hypothetical protein